MRANQRELTLQLLMLLVAIMAHASFAAQVDISSANLHATATARNNGVVGTQTPPDVTYSPNSSTITASATASFPSVPVQHANIATTISQDVLHTFIKVRGDEDVSNNLMPDSFCSTNSLITFQFTLTTPQAFQETLTVGSGPWEFVSQITNSSSVVVHTRNNNTTTSNFTLPADTYSAFAQLGASDHAGVGGVTSEELILTAVPEPIATSCLAAASTFALRRRR